MQETVIFHGDEATVKSIEKELKSLGTNQIHVSQRKNLDGNTDTWVAIATLAVQALPTILDFIAKIIEQGKKVEKIKVGSTEIEHPTLQDIDKLTVEK